MSLLECACRCAKSSDFSKTLRNQSSIYNLRDSSGEKKKSYLNFTKNQAENLRLVTNSTLLWTVLEFEISKFLYKVAGLRLFRGEILTCRNR
jgi:hypothetical protein